MRNAIVTLATAVALAGCGDPPYEQGSAAEAAVICVAAASGLRADDGACDWDDDESDDVLFFPYFYPAGYTAHAVGHKVSGGTRVKPHTTVKVYRVPPAGGTTRVYTVPGGPAKPPAQVPAKPAQPAIPARPAAPPAPAKPFNPPPGRR